MNISENGVYVFGSPAANVAVLVGGTFGGASVTVGYTLDNGDTVYPFQELTGQVAAFEKVVSKGQGAKIALTVAGASGTSLVANVLPV